jgi:hypothetical protein
VTERSTARLRGWRPIAALLAAFVAGVLLAGCSTSDDEGDKTPTVGTTATIAASAETGGATTPPATQLTPASTQPSSETVVPATLGAGNGETISDGICQATTPAGWVDDGTGRGTTTSGVRYVLFGGLLKTNEDWQEAVDLVKKQAESTPDAKVTSGDDFIRVDLPNDRGFEYRGRFGDRYCDFTVTGASRPIPADERAFWDAIIASLGPSE